MDMPWKVPEQWQWVDIKTIGDVVSGGTPSTKESSYWGGGISWISPADLTGHTNKTIGKGAKSITEEGLKNSSAKLMSSGSVHFSSRAPIGYVAISSQTLCTNQGFKSIVPATGVSNEYIYYYLKAAKHLAEERATGTTFREISGTAFGKLPIPVAPENEQHRIVAKIEELFSELDKGLESLKTAREQLKTYRQALLKHAFEGKLTEQWRAENADKLESADALLERIKQEREARYQQQLEDWKAANEKGKKKFSKPKKLVDIEINALFKRPILPNFWGAISLGNTGIWTGGGTPSKSNKSYWYGGDILWITPKDMKTRIIKDSIAKITLKGVNGSSAKYIKNVSILFVVRSGILRRILPVAIVQKGFTINQDMQSLSPYSHNVQFLYWYCIANEHQIRQDCSKDGTTVESIDVIALRSYPCPLLSRVEQDKIVSQIEEKMSVIDNLEVTLDNQAKVSECLRQSILKKAFSGQLVPQDPNDEPASVLLDRIAKEKAGAITKAKIAKTAMKSKATKTSTRKAS